MIPQSATSITDFKQCTMLYYLRHVLRLRPVEDAEAARIGTNWHKCLEILTEPNSDPHGALIAHLNKAYETCPPSVSLTDWEVERTVLLYSALGWDWYYQDDKIETVAREVHFDRQVTDQYRRRGKIDRIIRREGQVTLALGEYKSTTKPIDPGSLYWDRLNLDSQLTLYLIEARHAQLAGELEQYGIAATDPLISGVLYDVWHKPMIRPKKLSMAETKRFMVEKEYFGETFEVVAKSSPMGELIGIEINEVTYEPIPGAEPKPTKKNPTPARPFAIRETPEMFGARLLADIRENPEKHFARKSIARTDEELARLDEEYYNLARVAHFMEQRNLWFVNENHCTATYRCSFYPICFYSQDVTNGNVPDGFKCLNKK